MDIFSITLVQREKYLNVYLCIVLRGFKYYFKLFLSAKIVIPIQQYVTENEVKILMLPNIVCVNTPFKV